MTSFLVPCVLLQGDLLALQREAQRLRQENEVLQAALLGNDPGADLDGAPLPFSRPSDK
jgi:hypothetical protein